MTSGHTRRVGGLLAIAAAGLGLWALIVWSAGYWQLAAWLDEAVPMAPATAALFVLLGVVLARRCFEAKPGPGSTGLLWGGAIVTSLVCILELARGWHGWTLPWDGWFVREVTHIAAIPLAQMSPLTVVAFLLVAVVFVLKASGGEHYAPPLAVGLTGVGLLLGLLVVLGYATGSPLGYHEESVPMALTTGLGFVWLNLALLGTARLWTWLQERAVKLVITGTEDHPQVLALRLGLITVGLMLLLGLAGFVYIRSELTNARKDAYATLEAVARLKAEQIRQWRTERNAEAEFLMRTRAVAEDVKRLLERPDDEAARTQVIDWLAAIKAGERYEAVLVFDPAGRVRLALPESAANTPMITPAVIAGTLAAGRVTQVPLHLTRDEQSPRLILLVPIPAPEPKGGFAAVVSLWLNPEQYLFPLLRRWPVPSESGESLLVRRDGDEVVFLNGLRHLPVGPLAHRQSINDRLLPAARVVLGETGVIVGRDYRGVPVLATGQAIAGTPWFLVAKVNLAELIGPIHKEVWRSGLLLTLLLLGVLGGAMYHWRHRHAVALQHRLLAERERNELARRLTLLMQQANDIILLLDENWWIVEANQRALEAYGYTLEELRTLPPGGLRPAEEMAHHPHQMEEFLSSAGARFETVQVRKDGRRMPVEVSGRMVEIDGRRHVLAFYRDLTERKRHEAERERLTRLYATLSQINQAIVHATEAAVLEQEICRVLIEFGRFRLAWIGRVDPVTKVVRPVARHGDDTGYLGRIQVRIDDSPTGRGPVGCAYRENKTQVWGDLTTDPRFAPWREDALRAGLKAAIALPIRMEGEVVAVLTAYADEAGFFGHREIALLEEAAFDLGFGLTNLQREQQRREVEAELRASELRFRTIFDHAPVGISLVTEGRVVLVNAEHARITGVSVEASFEPGIFGRVSHPEDYARQQALAARFHRGEVSSYSVEKRYLHPDGRVQWAELASHQYIDPNTNRPVIVTIITDIAERKAAEERLQRQLDELRRWHEATLGREERVMDLKREVNELLAKAGQPPRYASAETDRPASDDAAKNKPA